MGVINSVARASRRSRRLTDAALTVLAAATVLLVVAVVLEGPAPSSSIVTDAAPSPLPSLESVAADLTPSASSEPVAPLSTEPSVTATPDPSAAAVDPQSGRPGLRLNVSAAPDGALRVRVTVRVRDDDGRWNGGTVDFGDGTRQAFPRSTRCVTQPAGSDAVRVVSHTYRRPGTYSVTVTVRTDRPCTSTAVESATRGLRFTASRTAPAPQRTATAAATASRRPNPTPSRTTAAPTPSSAPSPSSTPEQSDEPSPQPSGEPSPEPSPQRAAARPA